MDVKVAKAEKSYCMVHGQKPKHLNVSFFNS
nr:MAG TPA: hypothetical protein [Caudoviricetes sp.]